MFAVLISASFHDIRTREVPDIHWIIMGITGIAMMCAAALDGGLSVQRMMTIAGSVMILFDILYAKDRTLRSALLFYTVMASLFIIPLITASDDDLVITFMTVPICFLLFAAMYHTGTVKGGADVKCLITMAMVFPSYPVLSVFTVTDVPHPVLAVVFSFPVAVLFHAALLSLLAIIPIAAMNIRRGDTSFPRMLYCLKMNAADTENAHVWVSDDNDDCDPCGDGRIWVTPKIPFIVPITLAALIVMVFGNLLFLMV